MDDPPYILHPARKVRQAWHLSRASLYRRVRGEHLLGGEKRVTTNRERKK